MPTNNKSKTGASGNKSNNTGNKNSKSNKGMTAASMPAIPKARDRAKDMDNGRRSDNESFKL